MALGDIVLCRQRSMNSMGGGHLSPPGLSHLASNLPLELIDDLSRRNQVEDAHHLAAAEEDSSCTNESGATFLPNTSYLCDLRHDAHEATVAVSEPGVVSRWRMKDRVRILLDSMAMISVACMNCFNEAHNNCE